MNGTPQTVAGMNDLPVKHSNSSELYMRDCARAGWIAPTNIVRPDGVAACDVDLQLGGFSTWVVNAGKALVPLADKSLPPT